MDLRKRTSKTGVGKAEKQRDFVEFLRVRRNLLHQGLLKMGLSLRLKIGFFCKSVQEAVRLLHPLPHWPAPTWAEDGKHSLEGMKQRISGMGHGRCG